MPALIQQFMRFIPTLFLTLILSILGLRASADQWGPPVRGSWVRAYSEYQLGDVALVNNEMVCEIVVQENEHTAVLQAAHFLASDIETISGQRPPIRRNPTGKCTAIRLITLSSAEQLPDQIQRQQLLGKWEAYQILTTGREVWLVGSNFRGTAFAAYTLSERLGVDPLYHWTGYAPIKHSDLMLKGTNILIPEPTIKYRGFFHDDEDILPEPFDVNGFPDRTGAISRQWYERFFETALRLKLNQVAPYVRVQRSLELPQLASEWGLFFTSHHYDILLSNPWGFKRFKLAEKRGAGTEWDWINNRSGVLNYLRAGVVEHATFDCIWPVGLRATGDAGYNFPPGASDLLRRIFDDALASEIALVNALVSPDKPRIFHLTLYGEMLSHFRRGDLIVPPNVIVVWPDDGDGRMNDLPITSDQGSHGIYYHLSYYAGRLPGTKQITHTVPPQRVAEAFTKAIAAGATEYVLINVSELREYVMEARMIADIAWNASETLGGIEPTERYIDWWSREYFGAAAGEARAAYRQYHAMINRAEDLMVGSSAIAATLPLLRAKLARKQPEVFNGPTLTFLRQRQAQYGSALAAAHTAEQILAGDQQQFFFEQVTFGLLLDARQTAAALYLMDALQESDEGKAKALCMAAGNELEQLEHDIARAERPPFNNWYRETWIRNHESPSNVHRSCKLVRAFLAELVQKK